ncbi:MAG: hypothetical protein QWI37_04695 [Candidatus Cardinium sp.]|nr:hypothetical protein [Candidatus Cardinium sp.]
MLNTIRDALAWAENRVERARFASERCTYIANRVISISGRDLPPAAGALARRGAHPHAHGAARRGDRERIERFDDNVERIRQARDLSVNTRALLNHANGRLDNIQGLVEEAERVLNLYNRDFLTEHDPQTTAPERGSYGVNRILNSMRDMLRDANESAYDTSLDAEEAINNSNDMWDLYRDYYPNDWRQRR